MKTIFKVGDRVYDIRYGWGVVFGFEEFYFYCVFDSDVKIAYDPNKENIKLLAFTEYTLQGFSQERPKKEPEIGSLCLFNDYECDLIKNMGYTGYLHEIQNTDYPYLKRDGKWFKFCKQIKIEEI